ncbi:MAG: alkaline phosphatase [Pseudomonadales bacterium]|jgi:alkaline phosphatase
MLQAFRSRRTAALTLAVALTPSAFGAPSPSPAAEANPAYWRAVGAKALAAQAAAYRGETAKNVILFIGDGMGISSVSAARIYAGQKAGGLGEDHQLSFERFPAVALSKTYNTNQQTADSAGTMTAMITGVKTLAGVLSVDGSVRRGDCASGQGAAVPSLLEEAEAAGLATGVVSTARITHATPGATYAHVVERDWEGGVPEEAAAQGCTDIAAQFLSFSHGDGIDVMLGGGRAMFLPNTVTDPEYPGKTGARRDGRNLIEAWQAANPDGAYLWNGDDLTAAAEASGPVLGLFEPSHMQFEADRAQDPGKEPSLAEMTAFAMDRLSQKGTGYVLVVEAGRIDHAHHAGNAYRAMEDTVALDEAVATAVAKSNERETLILVTADHSHTLTFAGYPTRGNPILGLTVSNDGQGFAESTPAKDALGLPYTTLAYTNGPGYPGKSDQQGAGPKTAPHYPRTVEPALGRPDLTEVDVQAPNYLQEAMVPAGAETHGGEDVAVYGWGAGSLRLGGVLEQNVIYYVMKAALGAKLDAPAP